MARRVSLQTIADTLHVSKYAVSRALSGKPGVSDATRQRVLAAARALGYRLPAGSASGYPGAACAADEAASAASRGYVLVWMDPAIQTEASYWARVLTGVANGCAEFGWEHALVAPRLGANGEGPSFPAYMDRRACLGHIAVGGLPTATLAALQAMGGPLVLLDHEEPLVEADAVMNANADGAVLLASHLLYGGRRSFVFVGNDDFAPSFRERWLGCRSAVEAFGGETRLRKWTYPYPERRWSDALHAKLAGLDPEDRPDAFVCANDQIALELLRGLHQRGLRVPDDCAVTGFDNIEASVGADPALTTVELAKEALGRRAVEQLARRRAQPGAQPEKVLLSARLVVRSSG